MTCASIGQVAQTRLVVQAWCCKPLHYFDVLEEHVQCSFDFTSYEDSYLQFSDVHPVAASGTRMSWLIWRHTMSLMACAYGCGMHGVRKQAR